MLLAFPVMNQQTWTPQRLLDTETHPSGLDGSGTEKSLTDWFGGRSQLEKGAEPKIDDLTVAWAVSVKGWPRSVEVRSDGAYPDAGTVFVRGQGLVELPGKPFVHRLHRVGDSQLYVGASRLMEGDCFSWHYVVDGKTLGEAHRVEVYTMPPESKPDARVPRGKLEQQQRLTSQVFGGTWHDWWVYTPHDFDPQKESNLVVFQDGQWAHSYAPVYFDHLIAQGDLPQTVVIFVTPGTFPDGRSDRSREYDTLSNDYARFLLEELLPQVESRFKITHDPSRRCLAGLSSGGICSFTAAWQRPDAFGLVLSWIGSFTNIASGATLREGGHNYPALIRKTEKKPIRVFLQDGSTDLDNVHGNWPLANHEMAKALEFKGYQVKTVWGRGGHSDLLGRATLADALRWLFGKK